MQQHGNGSVGQAVVVEEDAIRARPAAACHAAEQRHAGKLIGEAINHFVELAVSLAAGDPQRRVLVTSGPSEQDVAGRVIAEAQARLGGGRAGQVLSCGEFSLAELRALLDRATLYIGGDSGPLHVAATTRVPIVGLYGPTLPIRSAPWRDGGWITESVDGGELPCRPCNQRACAPGDFRCLTSITSAQVLEAADRALRRSRT